MRSSIHATDLIIIIICLLFLFYFYFFLLTGDVEPPRWPLYDLLLAEHVQEADPHQQLPTIETQVHDQPFKQVCICSDLTCHCCIFNFALLLRIVSYLTRASHDHHMSVMFIHVFFVNVTIMFSSQRVLFLDSLFCYPIMFSLNHAAIFVQTIFHDFRHSHFYLCLSQQHYLTALHQPLAEMLQPGRCHLPTAPKIPAL